MIGRSTIKPKVFWLRKKEMVDDRLIIWLRVRWNIKAVEVEDMDKETHQEWEYNEEEVKLSFDADLFDETANLNTQVKAYLRTHKTALRNRIKKIIFLRQYIESIEKEMD